MKSVFILMLAVLTVQGVEPCAPRFEVLNTATITDVTLSDKVTTILEFPEEVTLVVGAGLTDGKTPGIVQCEHPQGSRTVALRGLGKQGRTLIQVQSGSAIYVYRLAEGDRPDSVLHLSKEKHVTEGKSVLKTSFSASSYEIEAILLAACRGFVGEIHKPGTPSVEIRSALYAKVTGEIETVVKQIARSSKNDVIVVTGSVRNLSNKDFNLSAANSGLLIGGSRRIKAYKVITDSETIGGKGEAEFFLVAAGDGEGFRANISIRNRFDVTFESREDSPQKPAETDEEIEEP